MPNRCGSAPPGTSSDNLHFVAVHPQFAENHFVYFSYPKRGERGFTLGVARGRLDGGTLSEVRDIFVADAWETGGNLAGRIMFAPDGSLYVTSAIGTGSAATEPTTTVCG